MKDEGPSRFRLSQGDSDVDDQIQRLVRTEQQLVRSQRDLQVQVSRVDAMNRFSFAAGRTRDAALILELASELFFEVFPFEQALGLLRSGRALRPTAVRAVRGREADSADRLGRIAGIEAEIDLLSNPVHGAVADVLGDHPGLTPIIEMIEQVFGEDASSARADRTIPVLLLPLPAMHEGPPGLLVLRRPDRAISFHDTLPSERDLPFLRLVAQQVAVAVSNAQLVHSLRRSYGDLAQAQKELVERERLAAIGELAAVIAHEVRNPLGSIFNSLSTLQRIAAPREPVRILLDIVGEEAVRLNRIVGDLLDFARPQVPELRVEPLDRIVRAAVESTEPVAEARGIAIDLQLAEGAASIVDSRMMHQALVNLITNAIQQTPARGGVTIRVARDGEATNGNGAAGVVIEVIDRGPGIEPEHFERIFEPFFTTKATGTGLGLAVVKRFVEAQGGAVDVRSVPESETVFVVRLPCAS